MEISELKARLSILEVAERLGITVNQQGKAHCPFHADKTPSLQFSKEKNIATCFSSRCDAGTMDIISLTEKHLQVSTREAIMQLKTWAQPGQAGYQLAGTPADSPTTAAPKEADVLERIAILTKAFRYFENGIKTSKKGKQYLTSRGLVQTTPNQQGVEVGLNTGNFHRHAAGRGKDMNPYLLATAAKYGLIYQGKGNTGGYRAFAKDSLVFPLKNVDHKIVGLYFRLLNEEAENKQRDAAQRDAAHRYLKDRQGLYPQYPQPDTKRLILTEAIIDAATLLPLSGISQHHNVLACYGTNGLTEEHIKAIQILPQLQEITFFFDGDQAGAQGIEQQAEKLRTVVPKVKLYRVATPEGEDVNSLYVSHQEEAEALFQHLLKTKLPIDTGEPTFFSSGEQTSETGEKTTEPSPTEEPPATSLPAGRPSADTSGHRDAVPVGHDHLDTTHAHQISYTTPTASYYVKGGLREELDRLQVSLMIEVPSNKSSSPYRRYRNRLDLYENKQVERIAREASDKLSLRADLLELDLHRLTDLLEDYREGQRGTPEADTPRITVNPSLAVQCQAFLNKPDLLTRLNELIGKAGVVGEEVNRLFLFCLAATYKMPHPLHALIQGSSGSGKTHLLIKISHLMPDEDVKRFTRVTDSSFYNYGEYDLRHKLICLEDLDGMKEEAQLAFRELQSRGMLSSSTTGQDEKGYSRAYEKIVYGPIASLCCTTHGHIYEDNMGRCFLIAVDETNEQTERIIHYQNQKASGKHDREEQQQTTTFIQNCIRLLKPLEVINPYADRVQLPPQAHKIRRLNELYQSFVQQITLLHQYQRKQDSRSRLIAQKEDLQQAADIMFDSIVLKVDELDGSLRHFYERLKQYVRAQSSEHYETYSFSQREVRQALHVSKSQLQRYLYELVSLEYISLSGGHSNKGYRYKIVYWDNMTRLKAEVKRHLQGQLDQLEIPVDRTLAAIP